MKRWEFCLLLSLILALVLSQFASFAYACDDVCRDTLRLHILANSDSDADQACKLAVRDAILQRFGTVLAAASTKREAVAAVQERLAEIQALAEQTVRARGFSCNVCVRLENTGFDTRVYDGFTLPAGAYDALRVELGDAAGHNWFCVLYPALCLGAASGDDAMEVYSEPEREAVTTPYTVKFAVVEWIKGL